jgi:hypothetical protein
MKKILAITLLLLVVGASQAFAAPTFSADVEINTTYDALSDGSKANTMDMGGRVLFTAAGKIESDTGFFAAGQGQVLANLSGSASVDDAWGQIGTKSFSLKMGRFEAQSLLDAGEDVYVASAGGTWYTANAARGRTTGGMALDFNASDNMMIEVGAVYGQGTDQGIAANRYGVRPLVKLSVSNFTVVAGADVLMLSPKDPDVDGSTSTVGFGGMVIATLGNITVGGGAASGKTETKDYVGIAKSDQTITTMKAWVTMPMGDNKLGLGAGYSTEDVNDSKEMYGFAVYEIKLPVEGAWIKIAGSYASAKDVGGTEDRTDVGGRVRLNYTF